MNYLKLIITKIRIDDIECKITLIKDIDIFIAFNKLDYNIIFF